MARGRAALRDLRPRARYALAWALGAVATTALPPAHVVVALLPAFTGLIWLIEADARPRAAFWTGWWFGFGFFAAGLYWISFALLVDAARFGWLIPVAIVGLGGGFAFYVALAAWAARRLAGKAAPTVRLVGLFAALWVVTEWMRGWFLTGFPWNPIGSVWAFSDAALQPAAWVGALGVGFVTVLAAALPAALANPGCRAARRATALVAAVIALGWIAGGLRLPDGPAPTVDDVRLRLVQPAIAQAKKWQADLRWGHVVDQVSLGARPPKDGQAPPTHVIWAETAAPIALGHDKVAREVIGANTPDGGVTITGAIRTTPRGEKPFKVWNSLLAIKPDGTVAATFDKFHLVPFGEYMPLGDVLGLKKITPGRTDFSAGPGPVTLRLPGLPPVSPLICYEIIFSGAVADPDDRPEWILNLTNDAWYGRTTGPHQHFTAARLRAVEEGLPVVRVANTGISGVIDPYGRVIARLGLGARGTLDSDLPRVLSAPTPYGRTGKLPVLACALVLAFALWRRGRKSAHEHES
jgi:apolipoprotein N-acyltransferase